MQEPMDEDDEDKPKPTFTPPTLGAFKAPNASPAPEPEEPEKEPEEIKYFDAKDYDKVLPKPVQQQTEKIEMNFPDVTKEHF